MDVRCRAQARAAAHQRRHPDIGGIRSRGSIFIGVQSHWMCAAPHAHARVRRRTRRVKHTLEWDTQPWQHVHQGWHLDIGGIHNLVSICTRRLSQTSLEYAALASLFTRGGADPSTFAACRRGCAAWHEPRRHKTLEDDRDGRMQRRRALLISDSGGLFGSKARQFAAVSQ